MWKHQASVLIKHTLKGTRRSKNHAIEHKAALTVHDLLYTHDHATLTSSLDILLFDAQLHSGFCGLLRLGELVLPDNQNMRDWKKVTMHHTLEWLPHAYAFWLPHHKSDSYFEGNHILCRQIQWVPDPVPIMWHYLKLCDSAFQLHPQLWLHVDDSNPLCSWWMSRFRTLFPNRTLAGQSMWAGGATALAEAGTVPDLIMGSGRWSSQAWTCYVHKNPVLLHALIIARTNHFHSDHIPAFT